MAFYVTEEGDSSARSRGGLNPSIAIAKVFLKFLRELYTGSYFYHAGDITAAEAPSEVLEERLADAAETVLAEQIGSESGDELLAPAKKDDDPIALEEPS